MADSRIRTRINTPELTTEAWAGLDYMVYGDVAPGTTGLEPEPVPHDTGLNSLFCDGHVTLVHRRDLIDHPTRAARNWNNDYEPHPETWNYTIGETP